MNKTTEIAKTSTKAGFNYLWGLVISTVISSIGTIYMGKVLGDNAYGLYTIAFTVPNLIMLFRDWGINQAIIRYTAQCRAENRETELRNIFITGIVFEIIIGLILSIISFLLSGYIATTIHGRPEIVTLIQIASFSILANGLITVATAVFIGTEKTTYNSTMLICQSTIKTSLMLSLVLTGFGTCGAVTGFTTASIIAGLLGITFTILLYYKLPKTVYKLKIKEYTKKLLTYSTPLSIATILSGILAQFYIIILSHYHENNALIGNYAMAQTFVILIGFFALPITNMLFPAFSKLDIKKDKIALKNVFQYSVKYTTLIIVPVTTLIMCLSTPAVTTIFENNYGSAPLFLSLLAISYLFSAAGNLSINNIINSQGKTSLCLKYTILTVAIGFPLGFLLIKYYSVFGLIFTSLCAPIPSLILSLIWIKKHYDLTINWISSAKILLSAAITATLTYILEKYVLNTVIFQKVYTLSTTFLNETFFNKLGYAITETWLNSAFALTIGTIFFIITFITIIILTKTLSTRDINNLHDMTTGLGPITKIVHTILNIIEKIMKKLKLI